MSSPFSRKAQLKSYVRLPNQEGIPTSTCSDIKRRILNPKRKISKMAEGESQRQFRLTEKVIRTSNTSKPPSLEEPQTYHLEGAQKNSVPLYPGSKVTTVEATVLLTGFIQKYKLTRDASHELMTLIKIFIPVGEFIPENVNTLKQKIKKSNSLSSVHVYCPSCDAYIGRSDGKDLNCEKCNTVHSYHTLNFKKSYFLMFDVKRQLEVLLRNPKLSSNLHQNLLIRNSSTVSSTVTDIIDGAKYRTLGFTGYDISCSFNTDGVPLFKSSKFSAWPILISLNELSYAERVKSTFTVALWVGKSKPNFQAFFVPFVNMCNDMSTKNLVNWKHSNEELSSRVYFILCVADSVARCQCQGTMQFNGAYGCSWCLNKGENFQISQRKRKWIYPSTSEIQLRTKYHFYRHLKEYGRILENNPGQAHHYGIKKAFPLLHLTKFDIVDGFVFDEMHAVFLGVVQTLTNIWIDSKYHGTNFYIGLKTNLINKRLNTFRVPRYFGRSVRSLDDLKFWKASEWRTWTFISVFVLDNIIPRIYLSHFAKLSKAIMILSQRSVSREDISAGRMLLREFVNGILKIYGPEFCTFNVHSLLHAAKCVNDWGSLYLYSAFQFEDYNGMLLNIFNGSNNIEAEICNKLNDLIWCVELTYDITPSDSVNFFFSIMKNRRFRKATETVDGITLFGGRRFRYLSKYQRDLLQRQGFMAKTIKCFDSCIVNSLHFTIANTKSEKRSDCIAGVNGNFFVVRDLFVINNTVFCFATKLTTHSILDPFCYKVHRIGTETILLNATAFKSKFICSQNELGSIVNVLKLPNALEIE